MKQVYLVSIIFCSLLFLFLTGCVSTGKLATSTTLASETRIEPLKSSDYEVMGDAKGSSQSETFLGFITIVDSSFSIDLFGFMKTFIPPSTIAKHELSQNAIYDAVKSVPGADAVIAPTYRVSSFNIPFLYGKATLQVEAKAIRLKEHK